MVTEEQEVWIFVVRVDKGQVGRHKETIQQHVAGLIRTIPAVKSVAVTGERRQAEYDRRHQGAGG